MSDKKQKAISGKPPASHVAVTATAASAPTATKSDSKDTKTSSESLLQKAIDGINKIIEQAANETNSKLAKLKYDMIAELCSANGQSVPAGSGIVDSKWALIHAMPGIKCAKISFDEHFKLCSDNPIFTLECMSGEPRTDSGESYLKNIMVKSDPPHVIHAIQVDDHKNWEEDSLLKFDRGTSPRKHELCGRCDRNMTFLSNSDQFVMRFVHRGKKGVESQLFQSNGGPQFLEKEGKFITIYVFYYEPQKPAVAAPVLTAAVY